MLGALLRPTASHENIKIEMRSNDELCRWSDHGLQRTVHWRLLRLGFNFQSHLIGRGRFVGWRGAGGEPVGVVKPRHDGVRPGPSPRPGLHARPGHRQAGDGVQPGPRPGLVQAPAPTEASSHHRDQTEGRSVINLTAAGPMAVYSRYFLAG